jgi:hypothetical protein
LAKTFAAHHRIGEESLRPRENSAPGPDNTAWSDQAMLTKIDNRKWKFGMQVSCACLKTIFRLSSDFLIFLVFVVESRKNRRFRK